MADPSFVDALQLYFRGEKAIGMTLIPLGLAMAGFAVGLWRIHQTGLRAFAVPLLILGVASAGGGALLWLRTNRQVSELSALYQEDSSAFVRQELPRMEKVNANWPRLKLAWTILILLSLGFVMAVDKPWVKGAACAMLLLASLVMAIDVFAESRALSYTARIKALAPGAGEAAPALVAPLHPRIK